MELPDITFPFAISFILLLFSPSTTQFFLSPAATNNSTDYQALLDFKSLLTDPTGALSSWNNTVHFCRWLGVTCGSSGRVTQLQLISLQLTGPISPSIGNLSFLQELYLPDNNLIGPIPDELGRLSQLVNITLKLNYFTGEIPRSLTRCSNLQVINLRSNLLTGEIPRELGLLSKLRSINLWSNHITGSIPDSIGNLSSLQYIIFAKNGLVGSIPENIGRLTNLLVLQMESNNFTGEIPSSFFNLSSILLIYLGKNQLEGSLPSTLFDTMPYMKHILLNNNQFNGTIPASVSNASHLVEIDLSVNHFCGTIPSKLGNSQYLWWVELGMNRLEAREDRDWNFIDSMANCSHLEVLDLQQNNLSGVLPSSLANLSPGLSILSFPQNRISGSLPSEIGNLVNLTIFEAYDNLLTGPLPASIGKLKRIHMLTLHGNKFIGRIPNSMSNLVQLNRLHLQNNRFNGSIPVGIGSLVHLQELDLSWNRFNGEIPKEILSLMSLSSRLDLSNNLLTGPLPVEVGRLVNLNWLAVANNNLSGEIPSSLRNCLSLEYLYLQGNSFDGAIPQYLSNLKGLRELDLSSNSLSQQIPKFLENMKGLQLLNLSFNELEGQVPAGGIFKNSTAVSLYGNKKLCGGRDTKLQLPSCDDLQIISLGKKHLPFALKVLIPVIGIALCSVIGFSIFCACRVKSRQKKYDFNPLEDHFRRISYAELRKATDGFSSSNLIGFGSFGSVYKGIIQPGESAVAVKVLNLQQHGATESFMSECKALRGIRHRNLVQILTACSSADFNGNDFKALVLKYMPNGSLDQWLHPVASSSEHQELGLLQRLNIAVDVASALDYLHNQSYAPIVHCDLKPSNVLLDDEMCAHLSDFGLARILVDKDDKQTASIGIKGTIGYVPPEYGMGSQSSPQGDVYSYGILLLELFTGKRPTHEMFKNGLSLRECVEKKHPDHLLDIIDPSLITEAQNRIQGSGIQLLEVLKCLGSVIKIGLLCSLNDSRERMEIGDVSKELNVVINTLDGY